MKRLFRTSHGLAALLLLLLAAGPLGLSSCTTPTVGYQAQGFATLRVMNFMGNCSAPIDIYWDAIGATPAATAKMYALNYGTASVYSTGILTGNAGMRYHLSAKMTRDTTSKTLRTRDVMLMPGQKYSWILSLDAAGVLSDTIVTDADQAPATATDHSFIRFANEMPGTPNLALMADDPVLGLPLSSTAGVGFRGVDKYFALPAAADVGYAFFVVNAQTHAVVARLVNQTPVPGEYYTLAYGGDLCRTPLVTPEDTVTDAQDTIRLRTFDDNLAGNDLTVPVPSSMRYNVINAVYPDPKYRYSDTVRDPRGIDTLLGFVFNTFTLPQKHNFTFDPVPPFHPGGLSVSLDAGNGTVPVYNVAYQNGDLPNPLDIRLYAMNLISDTTTRLLFDYTKGVTSTAKLVSDHSYSFIWSDTVTPPAKAAAPQFRGTFIPMPDVSIANGVRLVFVPAIISVKGQAGNKFWGSFSYSVAGGAPVASILNKAGGGQFGKYDSSATVTGITAPTEITVTTQIGDNTKPALTIAGPTATFTAEPGGIYEVALVGKREDPRIIIVRTNKVK